MVDPSPFVLLLVDWFLTKWVEFPIFREIRNDIYIALGLTRSNAEGVASLGGHGLASTPQPVSWPYQQADQANDTVVRCRTLTNYMAINFPLRTQSA